MPSPALAGTDARRGLAVALEVVRTAVADSGAVPVIREAQRANLPYGNSGVNSSHHGQHRMNAPFVSAKASYLQRFGDPVVEEMHAMIIPAEKKTALASIRTCPGEGGETVPPLSFLVS